VRKFGGLLLLDDTQALGILGKTPSLAAPYGLGGGGSLRWHNISGPDVLVVSSLAKGFGVPIAVLSGSENMIRRFEEKSETRVHCSPPSVAVIHATEQALIINQVHGDVLRGHLVRLVRHLRTQLSEAGFSTIGWLFPVQTLAPIPGMNAATLYRRLLQRGIRAVLRRGHSEGSPCLSFLITTRHWPSQIDRAVEALEHAASTKTA
jgi:8-amino-7-oxononanoate synthase